MGFEEIFVFVVIGCVASYYQRSQWQSQTISLWTWAIALPCLAIAWITFTQTPLPLTLAMTGYLLGAWIYRNWQPAAAEILSLSPSEEKQLKECFSPTIYHLKDLEYRPHEIYCRGSLRSQNYKYAYGIISQNIQKAFGDRFLCYLQESPIENLGRGFGSLTNDQQDTNYYFYLIPTQNIAQFDQSNLSNQVHWIPSIISILFTGFTVLLVGAKIHHLEDLTLNNLQTGIPYLIGIASIFIARAITQYYVASKHNLRFDPPILLPCFGGFGLLGHLNHQISQSLTKQRHILFDMAVIPAIASLAISGLLLILGNWLLIPTESSTSLLPKYLLMPNLHNFDFKNSIFVTLWQAILTVGKSVATTPETIPTLSPLTLAGWTGLAITALQLLPFRFLDGGNLAIAMFGYRQTAQIARIARIVLLAISLVAQPWLRIYSLVLFLLPVPHPLVVNESIEIDKARDLIGIGLMAIALLIILPMAKPFL